ncbi:MAG: hypothetical protein KAJ66_02410, partial [Candidatus Omnitrophica bacterium]|nr:hypothetical protein [Candidatus Omnitrophota bacterium]
TLALCCLFLMDMVLILLKSTGSIFLFTTFSLVLTAKKPPFKHPDLLDFNPRLKKSQAPKTA